MDPVAGRGGRRNRRGSRGLGRPGRSEAVEGWTSATASGRPTTSAEPSSGGAAPRRASAAGRRSQRGGTMVWRPRLPQPPAQSGSAEGASPAVPAALDNEDILGEILLRLPALSSSLPRAGAVCKRWWWWYPSEIVGFAEDYNVLFLASGGGVVFMVHLESVQFKKLLQKLGYRTCYPFTSFCTAGPAPVVSLLPPAMREDLLTRIEVVKDHELNLMVEDHEVDRWDPMILEASMPTLDAKGHGL